MFMLDSVPFSDVIFPKPTVTGYVCTEKYKKRTKNFEPGCLTDEKTSLNLKIIGIVLPHTMTHGTLQISNRPAAFAVHGTSSHCKIHGSSQIKYLTSPASYSKYLATTRVPFLQLAPPIPTAAELTSHSKRYKYKLAVTMTTGGAVPWGREYLDELFGTFEEDITDDEGEGSMKSMEFFHDVFSSGSYGGRLIDIGSGSTLYQVISASRFFSEIVCSDYSKDARTEIEKWLKKDKGAFDWTSYFQYFIDLEGSSEKIEDREQKLRQAIKAVVHCDVLQPNPTQPLTFEPFDVMISAYCLEVASPDRSSYAKAVANISTLLKPGGTIVFETYIGATFAVIGGVKSKLLPVEVEFVVQTFKDAGFCDIQTVYYPSPDREEYKVTDVKGMLFFTAKKCS
ncbi:nicotinamide N-methyltransferase-like [Branchiostoma floridae x Branchiostoma japonicum]